MSLAAEKNDTCWSPDRLVKNGPAVFIFFLALNFVAHFLYFRNFGFYGKDDYSLVTPYLEMNFPETASFVWGRLLSILNGSLGHEGRPIAFTFMPLVSNIGMRVGGLAGLYLIALLMAVLSSFFMYRVFAVRGAYTQGFAAGLFITLHPALTLRPFLTVEFGMVLSLIFILIAIACYMKGRRITPYLLVAVALLTYESTVLPFFAAPLLLDERWDGKMIRRLVVNAAVVLILIVIALALRSAGGEGRVGEVSSYLHEAPMRIIKIVAYGSFLSFFYAFYNAFAQTISNLDIAVLATIVSVSGILAYLLYRLSKYNGVSFKGGSYHLKLMTAGVVMVMFSYATGFYSGIYKWFLQENMLNGIFSRINMSALPGAAVFFSALYMLAVSRTRGYAGKLVAAFVFALPLGVFAGFGQIVQYDYKKAWEIQQCVWNEIISQTPDVDENTVILMKFENLPSLTYTPYPLFSTIGMPMTLARLFGLPRGWKSPRQLNFKKVDWMKNELSFDDNGMKIYLRDIAGFTHRQSLWVPLLQEKLIFFKIVKNNISRLDGTLQLNGHEIRLKPKPVISSPAGNGCKLNLLTGATSPRDIESKPKLTNTLIFNGKNHLSAKLPESKNVKQFTIELWLRPRVNVFSADGRFDNIYPPMPAIIGPFRLDHREEDVLGVSVATEDKKGFGLDVRDMFVGEGYFNWLHLELDVDNDKREAMFFVNGRVEKKFVGVKVPLSDDIMLGKGHMERFWKGEIADVRISSTVRHASDFEPEKNTISRDEHTLYLMDGM